MAHVRKQLRAAIEAAVAVALVGGTKLKPNATSVDVDNLPAWRVIARRERQDADALSGGGVDRVITVGVIVNASATDDLDDVLDDLAALVEPAVLNDNDVGDIAHVIEYVGSEISPAGTGEKKAGAIEIAFEATVMTPEGDPETIEI